MTSQKSYVTNESSQQGDPRLANGNLVFITHEGQTTVKYCIWCIPGGDKEVAKRTGVMKMTSGACPAHFKYQMEKLMKG